jgi:drug/metabolite transporter (DMT)-like permease
MVWRRVIAIAIVVGALLLMTHDDSRGDSYALDIILFLLCLVGVVAAQKRDAEDEDF